MDTTESDQANQDRMSQDRAYIIGLCLFVVGFCLCFGFALGVGYSIYRSDGEEIAIASYDNTTEGFCFQGVLYNTSETDVDSPWKGRPRLEPTHIPQPSYFDEEGNEVLSASHLVNCRVITE